MLYRSWFSPCGSNTNWSGGPSYIPWSRLRTPVSRRAYSLSLAPGQTRSRPRLTRKECDFERFRQAEFADRPLGGMRRYRGWGGPFVRGPRPHPDL